MWLVVFLFFVVTTFSRSRFTHYQQCTTHDDPLQYPIHKKSGVFDTTFPQICTDYVRITSEPQDRCALPQAREEHSLIDVQQAGRFHLQPVH